MSYALKTAGQILAISGLLHFVAPFVSGFSSEEWMMVLGGILYLVIAMGLTRGMRWLGYVSFFLVFILMIFALSMIDASTVPNWLTYAIVVVDVLFLIAMFVALWMKRPEVADV